MSAFARLRRLLGGRRATSSDHEAGPRGSPDQAAVSGMSCREVAACLFDFIDDEVDPALRARIEHHLTHGSCECRRALLMELAFDDRIRRCVCGHRAPDSLRRRLRALLTP